MNQHTYLFQETAYAQTLIKQHTAKVYKFVANFIDGVRLRLGEVDDEASLVVSPTAQWNTPQLERLVYAQGRINPVALFGGFGHSVAEAFGLSELSELCDESSWGSLDK